MKVFPLEKYRFYQHGNRIIAVSTYAGRTVRGVAICHPEDNFDIETGKRLAAARCNEKIAKKRMERAARELEKARIAIIEADRREAKMTAYYNDAYIAWNEAAQGYDTIIAEVMNK